MLKIGHIVGHATCWLSLASMLNVPHLSAMNQPRSGVVIDDVDNAVWLNDHSSSTIRRQK
jgi:hypothetical protein